MKISKELEDSGLTKEILLFFHSRTANSQKNIVKVESPWRPTKPPLGDSLTLTVTFESGEKVEYTLHLSKLRQKKLNLLLKK